VRYGLYYAPHPDSAFARLANAWLGRDAVTDTAIAQPAVPGFSCDEFTEVTAEARRYGFHGTIKAPFRLADNASETNLLAEAESFAASRAPVPVGEMEAATLHGFVALVPSGDADALGSFADEVVRHFDRFRAPLTPEERARRVPSTLSERQRKNLDQWGYPYIFDDFGFHLTLSKRLDAERAETLRAFANEYFARQLSEPLHMDALTLFVEKEPGSPLTQLARFPLAVPHS
tara:strand:+ start:1080 stop:1775 length:696 start_codon:yes stop_codon:yes gene_type:complete